MADTEGLQVAQALDLATDRPEGVSQATKTEIGAAEPRGSGVKRARQPSVSSERAREINLHAPDVPPKYRDAYRRAARGETSPREAIKHQCLDCMGFERTRIPTCDILWCPLWAYRPYQKRDLEAKP